MRDADMTWTPDSHAINHHRPETGTGFEVKAATTPEGSADNTERQVRAMCMAALVSTEYWLMKASGKTPFGRPLDCDVVVTIDGHTREMTFDEFEAEYAPWA
jgi:hypothetical protein